MNAPHLKDSYWQPIERQIRQFFFDAYFRRLVDVVQVDQPAELVNTRAQSALIHALESGRIKYDGVFYRGDFNAQITSEIRRFATWDKRAQGWRGSTPQWLLPTITALASDKQKMMVAVRQVVESMDIEQMIHDAVDNLNLAESTRQIDGDLFATVRNLGIEKDNIDSELIRDRINTNRRDNLRRDIVNWDEEQKERLRDMTQRAILNSYSRRDMQQAIIDEWGVSENKARFLARQEASLFFSAERRTLFENAGVNYYEWRCMNDARARDLHKDLDSRKAKVLYVFGEPPVTDAEGNHNDPGEDFGCRCVAQPVPNSQVQKYLDRGWHIFGR